MTSDVLPTQELSTCTGCGSDRLTPEAYAYEYAATRFPAARCAACGLSFLERQPTAEGLARLYDAEYFEADYHCGHEQRAYYDLASGQAQSAAIMLDLIESLVKPGVILEVGCAGGFFLSTARERGWSPIGVEVSEDAARHARDELGLDVRVGTIEEAGLADASLDAVYMGDVLEHLLGPLESLRALHRMIKPGGALMIAGPLTINSLDRRLGLAMYRGIGRTKVLREPPYHLTEFTPLSLRGIVERAGFEVAWLRQQKIPPAWSNPRRRGAVEHVVKSALDAVNWCVTRISGAAGDRAIVLARRH